jgi:adenine-specific DNA-methyltransferase
LDFGWNFGKGKVKLIYIDPPYNIGGDFQYNDRFNHST